MLQFFPALAFAIPETILTRSLVLELLIKYEPTDLHTAQPENVTH